VIGVVGGIGSGKSQVAAILARHGGRVIAADDFGHEALRQPELRQRIVARWGRELLDEHGEVQRRKLAAIVFSTPEERKALEGIVHPWITERIREEIARAKQDDVPFIVLDAAVMLEAGWNDVCDHLIYVDAPAEVRLQRVAGQRSWTADDLRYRESAQLPLTVKAAQAHHVVHNATTLEDLERQVLDLLQVWGLPSCGPRRPARPEVSCHRAP
jgi:dephospho-CoA kinase